MNGLKLVIIGQSNCTPCKAMKNQVIARINELERMETSFSYIDLDELKDREEFIEQNNLMCTPTTWIQKAGETVKEFTGYVDIDSLFETILEAKETV